MLESFQNGLKSPPSFHLPMRPIQTSATQALSRPSNLIVTKAPFIHIPTHHDLSPHRPRPLAARRLHTSSPPHPHHIPPPARRRWRRRRQARYQERPGAETPQARSHPWADGGYGSFRGSVSTCSTIISGRCQWIGPQWLTLDANA